MLVGRTSGLLLPLFSLRSARDVGIGDFGGLDGLFAWMQRAGQKVLMLLPLLPTAPGDPSPYATQSAFGLNPLFIHLGWLPVEVELTDDEQRTFEEARAADRVRYDLIDAKKRAVLERAFEAFEARGTATQQAAFAAWSEANQGWVAPYALFAALSEAHERRPWWEWPDALAVRDPGALAEARSTHGLRVRLHTWLQWIAEEQWGRVRAAARLRGIQLCGDEPFIIGQDSSDCWAFPRYLRRDARLGVPPDDFSADGQDWGLPWFDFEALEREGDGWLRARADKAAGYYDLRRVDHAIGYFRQYIRDAEAPRGRFVPSEEQAQEARGVRNFTLLSQGAGIVAEDLGVIPRFARQALAQLGIPGYEVMRWSREAGVYRDPREYLEQSLVTTGTHDTDSLRRWWETAEGWEREAACRTWPALSGIDPGSNEFTRSVHEALLRAALEARSRLCILPWGDVLGEPDRVNLPGSMGDHNWTYRMRLEVERLVEEPEPLAAADWLHALTRDAGRL